MADAAASQSASGRAAALADSIRSKSTAGAKKAVKCGSTACTGFRDFVIRGNVVDLAVAFVVGAAFTKLVETFVSSFVTPLISAIFGGKGVPFDSLYFTLNGSQFTYGKFINALISFLVVCLIVYFLVVLPLMHLLEALDPKSAARPCPECLSIIPAGARRCKFCTATVPLGASFKKKMKADESGELAADLKEVQDSKV